jgi:hypothetical protein
MDAASQMYTLEQIYDRLDTGAEATKMTSFTEPQAGPGPTGRTLDEVYGLAALVGNPDPPCFDNTNRYADCGNGTVHDQATNLIWLKRANCWNQQVDYATANNLAAGLNDGECDLTDGSSPGDWRLPTKEEWEAMVAEAVSQGCTGPALVNTPGTDCYDVGPQPFTHVQSSYLYWSSTAIDANPLNGWSVVMNSGDMWPIMRTNSVNLVWPVRAP